MTPSGRRSTAISRFSHSILRKAGLVGTAAAFPFILRLPKYWSVFGSLSLALDIDRLSLLKEGPDAFVEIFRAAAQDLVAVFHCDHGFNRAGVDAHVEAFLRQPQAYGRGRHHRIDIGSSRSFKLAFFDHLGYQTDRQCAFGMDKAPGQDQLARYRHPDQPRQEIAGTDVAA